MRLKKNPTLPSAWIREDQLQIGIDTANSFVATNLKANSRQILFEADGVKKFSKHELKNMAPLIACDYLKPVEEFIDNTGFDKSLEIIGFAENAAAIKQALESLGFSRIFVRHSEFTASDSDFLIVSGYQSLILDKPHLLINFIGQDLLIGPLVIPGITSCLNCLFLQRKDLNPLWPALAQSFDRSNILTDRIQMHLVANFVTQAVRDFFSSNNHSLMDKILELNLKNYYFELRELSTHPKCGCKW